ncbi:unnamed protein product [Cunninghamella blakesleeana]
METTNEIDILASTINKKDDDNICQVCQSQASKYKCPRCQLRTCSVNCVKQHKLDQSCSGERNKAEYVPLKQYNESNMMNDYVYLEDVSRQSDNLTRQRSTDPQFIKMDQKKKAIIKNARQAGIVYDMLPSGMSKHKLNRTNYSIKCRQIFWTIEFVFCLDDQNERILEHSCMGSRTLREVLTNMLFSENPQGKNSYATIRYQARHFIEAGIDQWLFGLKKEGCTDRNSFTNLTNLLDEKISTSVLKYERIIEYPTIYIWLKDHMDPSLQLVDKQKVEMRKNDNKDAKNKNVNNYKNNTDKNNKYEVGDGGDGEEEEENNESEDDDESEDNEGSEDPEGGDDNDKVKNEDKKEYIDNNNDKDDINPINRETANENNDSVILNNEEGITTNAKDDQQDMGKININ